MPGFKMATLVTALAAVPAIAQPYPYDLVYSQADGSLTILNDEGISAFVIESATDAFIPGAFTGVLGALPTSTSFEVSEANPFVTNNTPELGLGVVLPAGLLVSDFYTRSISRARYTAGLGQPITDFRLVFEPVVPGDSNGDGQITNPDLLVASSNYTGVQTDPPTYRKLSIQGDLNGDGAIPNSEVTQLIVDLTEPADPPVAFGYFPDAVTDPDAHRLTYFRSSGRLVIENPDGIAGFYLASDTHAFIPDTFDGAVGAIPFSTSFEVSEVNPYAPTNDPLVFLGAVLPAGLDEAGLNNAISQAVYNRGLAQPITHFEIEYLEMPGDTDGDGGLYNERYTPILNFTGPQTDPPTIFKTSEEGDFDGDGAISNADIMIGSSYALGPQNTSPSDTRADLVYDQANGSLTIINDEGISAFVIESTSDAFIPGAFTGVLDAIPTSVSFEVSEATAGGSPKSDPEFDLGLVLPAGLTVAGFDGLISRARYLNGLQDPIMDFRILFLPALPGDTNGDGDVDNADLQAAIANFTGPQTDPLTFYKSAVEGDTDGDDDVDNSDLQAAIANFTGPNPGPVPEPASLALLGLGGLLALRRWHS